MLFCPPPFHLRICKDAKKYMPQPEEMDSFLILFSSGEATVGQLNWWSLYRAITETGWVQS